MLKRIIYMLMIVGCMSSCRTLTPEQQAEKARMEVLQQKADSVNFVNARKLIENRDFVLEVEKITSKNSAFKFVNPAKNFLAVTDDQAIVQVAPFSGGGPNGVGGITVEGRLTKFETKEDRRGNKIFYLNISGLNISAAVTLTLYHNSNKAVAIVNPNFNSNNITLDGTIVSSEDSEVIQGQTF